MSLARYAGRQYKKRRTPFGSDCSTTQCVFSDITRLLNKFIPKVLQSRKDTSHSIGGPFLGVWPWNFSIYLQMKLLLAKGKRRAWVTGYVLSAEANGAIQSSAK